MKKRQQTEIDLLDLLKEFCYHWRSVLVCMLVFAILACGYCGMKNVSANKALQQQAESQSDSEIDEADSEINLGDGSLMDILSERGKLTEVEKSNVKTAVSIYTILQEYYNSIDDAYAQIGLANKERLVLQYAVRLNGSAENGNAANTLVYAIGQYINNGGLTSDIIESGYDELTADELNNRIKINYPTEFTNSKNDAVVQIVEGNSDVVPFTIICMGNSQKENETIGENVKKALDEFVQEYQELGSLELVLLGQYTGEVKDTSVLADKSTDTSAIVNQYSQFNNFVTNFSETQKAIFNEVVGSDVFKVTDEGIKTSLTADEQDSTQVPKISITAGMKKYVVLGLAVGLFLTVLCYGLYYIFTGTVKTKGEFERGYGLYCLGNLAEMQRKTSFDRLLQKLFGDNYDSLENRRNLAIANIRALCMKEQIKQISILSTVSMDADMQDNLEYIEAQLQKDGIEAVFVGNVIESVAGFDRLVDTGAAVLLEKTKETRYTAMNQMASICEEHGIDVFGIICM